MRYDIYDIGDRGLTFQLLDQPSPAINAHLSNMKSWIDGHPFAGLHDVIISYQSITLLIDRFAFFLSEKKQCNAFIREFFVQAHEYALSRPETKKNHVIKIPVCYDKTFAFDIQTISDDRNIPLQEIIRIHTSIEYTLYMIGFLPGFPYLGFVDERIAFPRKRVPMARVPAGSVGIAGRQTGIYPQESPGGWQIIGRTPKKLFDSSRTPPVELQPGDCVRFYQISLEEYHRLSNPS